MDSNNHFLIAASIAELSMKSWSDLNITAKNALSEVLLSHLPKAFVMQMASKICSMLASNMKVTFKFRCENENTFILVCQQTVQNEKLATLKATSCFNSKPPVVSEVVNDLASNIKKNDTTFRSENRSLQSLFSPSHSKVPKFDDGHIFCSNKGSDKENHSAESSEVEEISEISESKTIDSLNVNQLIDSILTKSKSDPLAQEALAVNSVVSPATQIVPSSLQTLVKNLNLPNLTNTTSNSPLPTL